MTADSKTEALADYALDRVAAGRSRSTPDPLTLEDERRLAAVYAEGWAGAGANRSK